MDAINFEILEDGTITMKTSDISDGNHMSADQLFLDMSKLMGGKLTVIKDPEREKYDKLLRSKKIEVKRK